MFLNWNPLLDEWVVWPLRAHPMVLQAFISPRTFEVEKAIQSIDEFDIALVERGFYDTETEEYKTVFSVVEQRQETS